MLYIRQGATHKVVIGPVVAVANGYVPVTTLSLATADEAEAILHDNGTVVDISGYTFAAITSADGYYHLTLQSGISNTVGHLTIVINDDSLCLPVKAEFTVVEEAVYDAFFASSALGYVANAPVNVAQFGGNNGTFSSGRPEVNTTHLAGTAYATALAALVDAVWDEVLSGATHNVAGSAGRRLRQLGAASITGGTAQAGTSNSITLAAGESSTDEIYDNNLIVIVGGTGAGQSRVIVEYNGTSKVATVGQVWEVTPDNTSEYEILADHQSDIVHHGLAQAGGATSITLATTASATDDVYNGSLVYLSTSTGAGQARLITDYDGTTKVATVSPAWATNPGANTVYKIIPMSRVIVDSGTVTTVTGAVGSVTGAVGSVTGNVGGNVVGSVGSVTGAVGSVTGNVGGSVASVTAGVTVTTNNDKTGYELSATGSAAMTEDYAALGAAATLPQLLYEVRALLAEKSISGTTLTTLKLDGSTTAATYTLDDATTPSAITRAT